MRRPRRPHSCLAHHLASDKGCRTMADAWSTRGLSVSSAEMSRSAWVDWDLPAPYLALLAVARADIDAYDHVNNAVYMTWFDRPAWLGDSIRVATWLLPADGKLRVRRRFQVRRDADGATLARAEIEYACIELSSGRPARWPPEFRERYVALDEVMRACDALAPI